MELPVINPYAPGIWEALGLDANKKNYLADRMSEYTYGQGDYYTFDAASCFAFADKISNTTQEYVYALVIHFLWMAHRGISYDTFDYPVNGVTRERWLILMDTFNSKEWDDIKTPEGGISLIMVYRAMASLCENRMELGLLICAHCKTMVEAGIYPEPAPNIAKDILAIFEMMGKSKRHDVS